MSAGAPPRASRRSLLLASAQTRLSVTAEASGQCRVVTLAEAKRMPFEAFTPVRRASSYDSQKHFNGGYWFASTGSHVEFRSALHRDRLILMDFDPEVHRVCPFPFYVHPEQGRPGRAPDFLVEVGGGIRRVVDVMYASRAQTKEAQRDCEPTREACAALGWEYRQLTEPDPLRLMNVRFMSSCRKPPTDLDRFATALLDGCRNPVPMGLLLSQFDSEVLVRPVLFHLVWTHRVLINLDEPLTDNTLVEAT
jgi:hypothetical protein